MAISISTLNKNGDFRRLYARGKVFTSPELVTYVMKNRCGFCRIGITASKKTGNAVERNRSRRVVKAAYASLCQEIPGGWDFVFVARSRTKHVKSTRLADVMKTHLNKAGVFDS